MKRMLSMLALLGTFLLLPLVAQAQQKYTVTFEQVEHCTITASYRSGGSIVEVQSGDQVPRMTYLTIKATPEEGYMVTHYIINRVEQESNGTSINKMVFENLTISAQVVQSRPCTVTITQPEHGTLKVTSGGKDVQSGTQINSGAMLALEITPEAGYEIEYWIVNGKKSLPNADPDYRNKTVLKLMDDITISAQLKVEGTKTMVPVTIVNPEFATIKAYKGTSSYDPELQPGEELEVGSDLTVVITPKDNLHALDYWFINNERVNKDSGSLSNYKRLKVVEATTISAVMKESGYKITYNQPEHGTLTVKVAYPSKDVPSGSRVKERTRLNISATVEAGYQFKHFLINGEVKVPTNLTFPILQRVEANSDMTIEAVIEKPEPCVVTITPFEHGTLTVKSGRFPSTTIVTSGKEVPMYTELTLEAKVDPDYEFKHFLVDGVETPSTYYSPSFETYSCTYKITKSVTIAVVAEKKPVTKVTIEPFEHGKLEVSYGSSDKKTMVKTDDEVPQGITLDVYAEFDDGYGLDHFLINKEKKSADDPELGRISVTVGDTPLTLSAVAKKTHGQIVMVQPESTQGKMTAYYSVDGEQKDLQDKTWVALETSVTFHVEPAKGYEMDYWLINDVRQDLTPDKANDKVITVEGDLKVQPVLKQSAVKYTITMIPPKPEEGKLLSYYSDGDNKEVTDGMSVEKGALITFRVVPAEGYVMDYWLINDKREGLAGGTMNNYKAITVESDLKVQPVLKATAAPQPETVLVKVSSEGSAGYLDAKYVESNGSGNPLSIHNEKRMPKGSVVTVRAKFFMKGDYQVVYTNNGNAVPTEALSEDGLVYTFTANEDADVHAVITEKPAPAVDYTVTFEAGEGGTVTATVEGEPIESGAKIPAGTMIKILPTPDEDYEVDQCLSNGDPVDDMELGFYYVKLLKDTHIKVTFRSTKPVEYVVTVEPVLPSAEAGTVQLFKKNGDAVESGTSVVTGTEMYVQVKPADKYELESLQVNNTTIKAGDEALVNLPDGGYKYVFTVTEATTIQATFKQGGAVEQLTASQIVAYVTNGGTRLEIAGATEGAEVRLYDYTGQLLLSSTVHALDISALPAGSYIVLVGNYTTRIVK